jgi:hypothetical protein
MRYKYIVLLIIPFLIFSACSKNEENKQQKTSAGKQTAAHTVTVEEVIQVTSYSYLRVKENDKEYWMAVTKGNFDVGQVLTYDRAMEMKNFSSSELDKTFETIYFVDNLEQKLGVGTMTQPQRPVIEKENISIQSVKGGVTIAQLFSNMNSYNGKTVKVRGKVVKINTGIMDKNWIHIQDGTSSGENFDLTITTNDLANIGDVVTFEGKIATNKDFGYGYAYKLIMENAKGLKNL